MKTKKLNVYFASAFLGAMGLMNSAQSTEFQTLVASQQAYIKASNTDISDNFGGSVALSGDTLVIGAANEGSNATGINGSETNNLAMDSGAVYVFVNIAGVWSQQAYIKASNTDSEDLFGKSVAVFGDTLVVGARLEDSNASGIGGNQNDNSLSGAGAAYVFVRNAGVWQQQAYLKASNPHESAFFGNAVAIDNDTIVVGSKNEDNIALSSGAVYVFNRIGGIWDQQAYLKAPNAGLTDSFGHSIAIDENTLVVGANLESSNSTGVNGGQNNNSLFGSGAAYVFLRNTNTWGFEAYFKASNTGVNDGFGSSVGISGNTIIVGAQHEKSSSSGVNGIQNDDSLISAGAAYVFVKNTGIWQQQAYLKASNTGENDRFGIEVVIDGNNIIVASKWEQSNATGINGDELDNSVSGAGALYSYSRTGNQWLEQDYIKSFNTPQTVSGDSFGESLTYENGTLVVGAIREDSSATGVDGDETNNSMNESGAAYLFDIPIELVFLNGFE